MKRFLKALLAECLVLSMVMSMIAVPSVSASYNYNETSGVYEWILTDLDSAAYPVPEEGYNFTNVDEGGIVSISLWH